MKKLLIIVALLFTSSVVLNAECTKEQKAKMIINGIDQATIDKTCSKIKVEKVLKKRTRRYAIKRERFYVGAIGSLYSGSLEFIFDDGYHYRIVSDIKSLALAIGYVFQNNDRVEFAYGNDSTQFEYSIPTTDFNSIKLSYIHTFGNNQVAVKTFTPFVSVGILNYYAKDFAYLGGEGTDGLGYSIAVGTTYSLDNHIELDLSYSYTDVDMQSEYSYAYMMEVDPIVYLHGLSVSIRYKF